GAGERNPFQASAKKAQGKEYMMWATKFLQRACAYRDIPRMSQERSRETMTAALSAQDKRSERPSPFFDDLQAIVDGKARKNPTDEAIPAAAVLALRGTLEMVQLPRDDPAATFAFGRNKHNLAAMFDIMDAEDNVTATAEGEGESADAASS
ncbi:unnamed protein product, partial [Pylaiella littoralis]